MAKKTELIQVGELAVGFSENVLPDTGDLTGKSLKFFYEDGQVVNYEFLDEKFLTWEVVGKGKKTIIQKESYRATCPRKNIYFVDYIKKGSRATSVSLIVDLKRKIATSLSGTLPTETQARSDKLKRVEVGKTETAVEAEFKSASLDKKFTTKTPRHKPSKELIGKRVEYVYSRNDTYEHVYLNEDHYTWHCLAGIETGMADTDLCHYFKIAKNLFFFVWREKLVPTLGVIVINLEEMKTTGKIFGYESGDFKALSNFPVGAYAKHVN
jgi:MoaF C-terminal domain/MoaF N-terminal domain